MMRPPCNLLFAAAVVAVGVAMPVAASAHGTAERRTVVAQVERDHLVVVVAYQPPSGRGVLALVAHATTASKDTRSQALRAILGVRAVSPLTVTIAGAPASPASIESRMFLDPPGSDRIAFAILLIYDLPPREVDLEVGITDEATGFSWVNRTTCLREIESLWQPRTWVTGVASFLLKLGRPLEKSGANACAINSDLPPSLSSLAAHATGSSTPTRRTTASRRSSGSRARAAARSSATSARSPSPAR